MSQARRVVAAAVVLAVLGTFGAATFGLPDMAGTPSYFDARDTDDARWLVAEGLPGLLAPAAALIFVLVAALNSARWAPSPRAHSAPLPVRLRAPPLR